MQQTLHKIWEISQMDLVEVIHQIQMEVHSDFQVQLKDLMGDLEDQMILVVEEIPSLFQILRIWNMVIMIQEPKIQVDNT